jgi:hypothetical protein
VSSVVRGERIAHSCLGNVMTQVSSDMFNENAFCRICLLCPVSLYCPTENVIINKKDMLVSIASFYVWTLKQIMLTANWLQELICSGTQKSSMHVFFNTVAVLWHGLLMLTDN